MKRTLVAAAVTALTAGTAFAQSSVTVYGRVNTSAEYQKNIGADDTQYVLQNNASRLGFMGTEDLGGGLKADFFLEHRFNSDTGTVTSDYWSGDAWLGLSGAFGNVRMGRLTSAAYYATADYVSMHNHDTGTSADALYTYLSGAGKNTVSYTTPNLGGFTIEGSVSAAESPVQTDKVWNLAAKYQLGALDLGAGYENQEGTDNSQIAVRGLYTLGAFVFGGYYQYSDDETLGNRNNFRLVGMYTMGASEFHLNMGFADDWDNLDGSAAAQYTVAYNYNLSKRTKVYAFYTMVDNNSNASYGTSFVGKDPSAFSLGVRHNF